MKSVHLILAAGLVYGCGNKAEETEATEEQQQQQVLANGNSSSPESTPAVPQVGSINLAGLGDDGTAASLRLADDAADKCNRENMGVFGLALGGACHTSGLAARIMLGSEDGDHNGDGKLDCGDFEEGKDRGIVLGMMCGDFFKRFDGIKSFAFAEPAASRYLGLSFADFDADDGVTATGSWSKGNAASYPANIRLWGSETSLDAMTGLFAANLASLNEGEVQVDFNNPEKGEHLRASSKFTNNLATKANCASDPSTTNCVFQEVKIYNPDDTNQEGAPNGMHIRIMTDDKLAPTFYMLEGRYMYRAEKVGHLPAFLQATREIYFRAVQQDGQIWGQFEFRDADGALVAGENALQNLILAAVQQGQCKSISDGSDVTCTAVDPAQYASLWQGREAMDDMSTSPVTADFVNGKPVKQELCLADFESCIDLSK
jgi:hypothetical protein